MVLKQTHYLNFSISTFKMKTAYAFLLFFVTFSCFMFYLAGMHGNLMFRIHKLEDWIIWSIAAASFVAGIVLLVQGLKKKIKKEVINK